MGISDFFNKIKRKNVFFTETYNEPNQYNPWSIDTKGRNDNYAITAFINMSMKGCQIYQSNNDYPRYLSYEFLVNDPDKYHKYVIDEGYLVTADSTIALKKLKLEELKSILVSNNIKPKYKKKDEIIQEVIENVDLSILNLPTYYIPSNKGNIHYEKYKYCLTLKEYDISFSEFDSYKERCHPSATPNDIIWFLLNERYNYYVLNQDFSSAQREQSNMAKLLETENKKTDALYHYIISLYYVTSGCGNKFTLEPDNIFIHPAITKSIHDLKEFYNVSMIDKCYSDYILPMHHIKKKNFITLITDIFEDKPIYFRNYL